MSCHFPPLGDLPNASQSASLESPAVTGRFFSTTWEAQKKDVVPEKLKMVHSSDKLLEKTLSIKKIAIKKEALFSLKLMVTVFLIKVNSLEIALCKQWEKKFVFFLTEFHRI